MIIVHLYWSWKNVQGGPATFQKAVLTKRLLTKRLSDKTSSWPRKSLGGDLDIRSLTFKLTPRNELSQGTTFLIRAVSSLRNFIYWICPLICSTNFVRNCETLWIEAAFKLHALALVRFGSGPFEKPMFATFSWNSPPLFSSDFSTYIFCLAVSF